MSQIKHFIQTEAGLRHAIFIVAAAFILLPLTIKLPFIAWEWQGYQSGLYSHENVPWIDVLLNPFRVDFHKSRALYQGLLLATIGVASFAATSGQRTRSKVCAALMAMLSGPSLVLLWEGNLAALTLFGFVTLPGGILFMLAQPHLTPWVLLSRRKWFFIGLAVLVISIALYGLWPLELVRGKTHALVHPIAMGWLVLGWPCALAGLLIGSDLLRQRDTDPDRLLTVGAFLAPYIMVGHLAIFLPTIGRLTGYRRVAIWLASWLVFLPPAFWYSIPAKYGAMIFVLVVYLALRGQHENRFNH